MAHISAAILAVLFLTSIAVLWSSRKNRFYRKALSNLPGPPQSSWFTGNLPELFKSDGRQFHDSMIQKYGATLKVHSLFGSEELYTFDPRAMETIFIKNQDVYDESEEFYAFHSLAFGPGLLATGGPAHKRQRKSLTPAFSTMHLRELVGTFYSIGHRFCSYVTEEVARGGVEIDIMEWLSRASLELIGQGGMGHTFNSLDPRKRNEYNEAARDFIPAIVKLDTKGYTLFLPYLIRMGPRWFRRAVVKLIPSQAIQRLKDMISVFERTSREVVRQKHEAISLGSDDALDQIGNGKDILSILLRQVMKTESGKVSDEELIGQMSTLIFAGHDTTKLVMSRIIWMLAQNPSIQDRLRLEVTTARDACSSDDLEYEILMNLPFLDAVCRETARLFPPVTLIYRVVQKDTVLPLLYPVPGEQTRDGKCVTEIPLKRHTRIIVSLDAANRSELIWGEDAKVWRPERWLIPPATSDKSKLDRDESSTGYRGVSKVPLPGTYSGMMTFLGGERSCIGFKFAELEIKLLLSILLEKFRFEPSRDVEWIMNPGRLQLPRVKGLEDGTPQLPLKVSQV